MSKERASTYPIPDRWSYLWLAIGTMLSLFSSGKWTIPLAAWLVPVFMIRFMRTQEAFRGFILVWLAPYVTSVIAWWGMMAPHLAVAVNLLILAISTLMIGGLSYLADRLLAPRLKGFAATLVFPLALTALDLLAVTLNPIIGSFGAQAYNQYGNLALMQLLSVTGMCGVTFLLGWFASVVNWAWERSFDWPRIWRGLALFAGIMLLVMAYGGARLVFSPAQTGTVRVASLTAVGADELADLPDNREAFRRKTGDIRDRYFEQTIREARAGAQIVLWPEGAGYGFEEDEAELIARGKEVAAQEGIYLAMPLVTTYEDPNQLWENKLIIVGPAGDIVLEHLKYGGTLLEGSRPGDRILRTVESPFGTISGVICWDADFPTTVRQAGRNGTDILLDEHVRPGQASSDFEPQSRIR